MAIYFYSLFYLKVSIQKQKIDEVSKKISMYPSEQQKVEEQKIFYYKKKIDDFSSIINSHKISSNIFNFIEKDTLPNIRFSSFSLSESTNEIKLTGETDNMETLSRQFQIFENDKDYVKNINVVDSKTNNKGTVEFTLNVVLDTKVFSYDFSSK